MAIASGSRILIESGEHLPAGGRIVTKHFAPSLLDVLHYSIRFPQPAKYFILIVQLERGTHLHKVLLPFSHISLCKLFPLRLRNGIIIEQKRMRLDATGLRPGSICVQAVTIGSSLLVPK